MRKNAADAQPRRPLPGRLVRPLEGGQRAARRPPTRRLLHVSRHPPPARLHVEGQAAGRAFPRLFCRVRVRHLLLLAERAGGAQRLLLWVPRACRKVQYRPIYG